MLAIKETWRKKEWMIGSWYGPDRWSMVYVLDICAWLWLLKNKIWDVEAIAKRTMKYQIKGLKWVSRGLSCTPVCPVWCRLPGTVQDQENNPIEAKGSGRFHSCHPKNKHFGILRRNHAEFSRHWLDGISIGIEWEILGKVYSREAMGRVFVGEHAGSSLVVHGQSVREPGNGSVWQTYHPMSLGNLPRSKRTVWSKPADFACWSGFCPTSCVSKLVKNVNSVQIMLAPFPDTTRNTINIGWCSLHLIHLLQVILIVGLELFWFSHIFTSNLGLFSWQ